MAAHLEHFVHLPECFSHSDCPALWRKLSEPTSSPVWCCWSPSSLSLATGSVRDLNSPWSLGSSHSRKLKVNRRNSSLCFVFFFLQFSQAEFSCLSTLKPTLFPSPSSGSGIILFIFHANFMNEITARLYGPCSVHAVVLNDKFQLPIFLVGAFKKQCFLFQSKCSL